MKPVRIVSSNPDDAFRGPLPEAPPILSSWEPQDLVDRAADPPAPPSILGLFYQGKHHVLSGEPETGKSWLILAALAAEAKAGRHTILIDHENGPGAVLERLRVLRCSDTEARLVHYIEPSEAALPDTTARLADRLEPSLVVVDATIGSLGLHRYSPNDASDVEAWNQLVFRPFNQAGAATTALDHLTKNPDNRGQFAIGSERKIGVADVHIQLEKIREFGRGREGKSKILVLKDRPGHLHRPSAGTFTIDSLTGYTYEAHSESVDEDGGFRPTGFMERISRHLEDHGPASKNQLEKAITGKNEYKRRAVELLTREGYIISQAAEGRRGATELLTSCKPYREHDETDRNEPRPSSPFFAPGEVPNFAPNPERMGRGFGGEVQQQTSPLEKLDEPCPRCGATESNDTPWPTAGGTYCCHDCARGEICLCKYDGAD